MIEIAPNYTRRIVDWNKFKLVIPSRDLIPQWAEDDDKYTVWGYDDPEVFVAEIFKKGFPATTTGGYTQEQNDQDRADFENNFKEEWNARLRRSLVIDKKYAHLEENFSGKGPGQTIDVSSNPMQEFSLQVSAVGTVTAWSVVLEGSLDNVSFTTILTHSNLTLLIGSNTSTAANKFPMRYFRTRVVSITALLGGSITTNILGVQ